VGPSRPVTGAENKKKMSLTLGKRMAAAAGGTLLLYAGYQIAAWRFLDVTISPAALPADLALHLAVTVLLALATRSLAACIGLQALLMGMLHLGHAGKVAFYGGPLTPDDFASLPALLRIAEGPAFVGLVLVLALTAALILGNLAVGRRRGWIGIGGLAAAGLFLVAAPGPVVRTLDGIYGHVDWDQRGNLERRGPAIHLVQEAARRFALPDDPPPRALALAAADRLLAPQVGTRGTRLLATAQRGNRPAVAAKRNVHMIVLESFWDAKLLTGSGLTKDPLDRRFRRLWNQAGGSRALSPVFGGHTANAEFEALCGFPVLHEGVVFESRLRRDAPCLPRLMGQAGYQTIASHPNDAAFWNRLNAYRRVGFETYWSDRDFTLDDMNEEFLADSSLYAQVLEKIAPLRETGTPTFNYVLTFFGHVGYPLNEARPPVVGDDGEVWLVGPYANTVHYKSKELMDFLEVLRKRDPEALIVIFGDHLPFLGFNHAGYTQAGLLAADRGEFTAEMFRTVSATPLIVIDGKRGPIDVGDRPIYSLPALILDLLGDERPTIMDYTRTPDDLTIRPFPGTHLVVAGDADPVVCRADDTTDLCVGTADWLNAVEMVKRDLFLGDGHAVPEQVGGRLP